MIEDLESDFEKDMEVSSVFQRLYDKSVDPHFVPNKIKPWKNAKFVRLHFFFGDRGNGKSVAMEETAEHYYNEGLNIWHIWAARSFENLFWCVNLQCGLKWEQDMRKLPLEKQKILKNRPHCRCNNAKPILIINPEYREWDMKSVEIFNGTYEYWTSIDEYRKAVAMGWISPEITSQDRKLLYEGKLKKPEFLKEKNNLIKIVNVPIPKNAETKIEFKKAFFKAALMAREEKRILVFNPSLCVGSDDKFKIIGEIMTLAFDYADEHLKELTEEQVGQMRGINSPIPYAEWSKREKGWNKVCIVLNELRSIAPTNKYSPQVGSRDSKRPIVDLVPELRHVNIWLLADLQQPDDLNASVRPMANTVILKGGGRDLFGDEYSKLFDYIEKVRQNEFRKRGFYIGTKDDEKFVPVEVKNIINERHPRIDELDKDKGYVTWKNGEYILRSFGFPTFHHRQEGENFWQVTGIKSWINERKVVKNSEKEGGKESKTSGKNKKESTYFLCNYAADLFLEGNGKWDDIPKKILEKKDTLVKEHNIPEELVLGVASLNGKSLNNKVRGIKEIATKLDKHKFDANFLKNRKETDS